MRTEACVRTHSPINSVCFVGAQTANARNIVIFKGFFKSSVVVEAHRFFKISLNGENSPLFSVSN